MRIRRHTPGVVPAPCLRWVLAVGIALCPAGAAMAEHATWLHGRWWRQASGPAAMRELARELSSARIGWVFPGAGALGRAAAGRAAAAFVRGLRAAQPGVRVLPWVFAYTHRHLGQGRRWEERTASSLARLVARSGADGVHLDIEPPFGSFGQIPGTRVARLGAAFRRRAPGALLSFALHPVATPSFPRGLDPGAVRAIAGVADQIVIMMYDTGISDPARFRRAVAEQMAALDAIAGRAKLWMGAAAYPAHRAARFRRLHDPAVENVEATWEAFREARAARSGPWVGLAVFAHYSARPADLAPLRRGREPRRSP